jgi:hypothetical protein
MRYRETHRGLMRWTRRLRDCGATAGCAWSAVITEREPVRRILAHLGMPTEPSRERATRPTTPP